MDLSTVSFGSATPHLPPRCSAASTRSESEFLSQNKAGRLGANSKGLLSQSPFWTALDASWTQWLWKIYPFEGLLKPAGGALYVKRPNSFVFQNPDHQEADSCHKVDNSQGNSSLDANDFYNELGDLGNLAGLDQTGSDVIPNCCHTTFSVDQSYGCDDLFLFELIDLDVALDCSSEFTGYKEIDRGAVYPNNNCESRDLYHSSNAFSVPALSQVIDIPDDRPDQFESQVNTCIKEGGADEGL